MPPSEDQARPSEQGRSTAVMAALAAVLDPELDESVVSLGFVSEVEVAGDAVSVAFRLPTYWCSPNFAWMMAEDMRAALAALPWVGRVEVRLVDHLYAGRINAAVNAGTGFGEAFDGAGGDLVALRHSFRRKAYLGRMAALIAALRAGGRDDAAILSLTIGDLREMARTKPDDPHLSPDQVGGRLSPFQRQGRDEAAGDSSLLAGPAQTAPHGPLPLQGGGREGGGPHLIARYLELRAVFGGPVCPDAPAFRTAEGEDLSPATLPAFLRGIRMTRRSAEANGEFCRLLLAERSRGRRNHG
jgi:metal-sulfur cluster biosynthetic enzyme